jgi:hypothetical protein
MYVAIHTNGKQLRYVDDELKLITDQKKSALFPTVESATRAITELERLGLASLFDFSIVETEKIDGGFVPAKQWK